MIFLTQFRHETQQRQQQQTAHSAPSVLSADHRKGTMHPKNRVRPVIVCPSLPSFLLHSIVLRPWGSLSGFNADPGAFRDSSTSRSSLEPFFPKSCRQDRSIQKKIETLFILLGVFLLLAGPIRHTLHLCMESRLIRYNATKFRLSCGDGGSIFGGRDLLLKTRGKFED